MKERLPAIPVLGPGAAYALRVQERFTEINGTALANGIALQTFLSIFPLVIVAIAVVGFLAAGDPDFTDTLISNLSLSGDAADPIRTAIANAQDSRRAASVIGVAGLLVTGLNLVTAVQRSVDVAWQTHGRGLKDKGRALVWLVGAALISTATFALAAVVAYLPAPLAPISILAGFAVNTALFLWTFVWLGRLPLGWRTMLPGALLGAIGFEAIKLVGSLYVPRLVADSSALYGSLGIVFALLAWLAVFGRLVVYGSVVNVVRYEDGAGTVTVPVAAPRVPGAIAVRANRAGAVVERL